MIIKKTIKDLKKRIFEAIRGTFRANPVGSKAIKPKATSGGLSMKGNIYSGQKCPHCGVRSFKYDDRRSGLFCNGDFKKKVKTEDGDWIEKYFEPHPECEAARLFKVQFGKGIDKRCGSIEEAERYLNKLRYEYDKGNFDPMDYRAGSPNNFENLYPRFIEKKIYKEDPIGKSHERNLRRYMRKAEADWKGMNVKDIGYAQIEDFMNEQLGISTKEKKNMLSCYRDFFNWLKNRGKISSLPKFPVVKVKLGIRKVVTKKEQFDILDEIKKISYDINPKIWLGIKWMATYPSLRPEDFTKMKEENIRTDLGGFRLDDPTKSDFKIIPMTDEDIKLVNGLVRGLPKMRFFRHVKGIRSVKEGQPFGNKYFYKWFKKAAANLGFDKDLDMYGATKHSTLTHLREFLTRDEVKEVSYHRTNKALERYIQADPNVKEVYEYAARRPKKDQKRKWGQKSGRLVKLQKKQDSD